MSKGQVFLLTVLVLLVEIDRVSIQARYLDDIPLNQMELDGVKRCEDNETLMELCAWCTKATKAMNVYPMCCLNEDSVGDWCHDFVYFGIQ